MPTTIFMGIDPGTTIMGWAFVSYDGNKFELLESGVIKPKGKLPRNERNRLIAEILNTIFHKRQPLYIATEKAYKGLHATGVIGPAESRGVIMALASIYKCILVDFAPKEVKKAVCGTGAGKKSTVAQAVKVLLRLEELPKYDDETDAMAIAITGLLRKGVYAIAE